MRFNNSFSVGCLSLAYGLHSLADLLGAQQNNVSSWIGIVVGSIFLSVLAFEEYKYFKIDRLQIFTIIQTDGSRNYFDDEEIALEFIGECVANRTFSHTEIFYTEKF